MSLLLAYRQEWFELVFHRLIVTNAFMKTIHQALVVHSTLHTPVINTIYLQMICPPLEVSQAHYIVEMVISCKTKVLNVNYNNLCSSEWIIQMLSHKSCIIEHLDIGHNGITSIEACKLLSCIKNIRSLRLRSLNLSPNLIDDTIANEIDACIMLEAMGLCCDDDEYSEGSFIDFTSLTAIKLFSSINNSRHSRLINVCIRGVFTDDQVAYEIATCFQQNCIFTTLIMYSIDVSDEACLQIINALEYNTTLQTLYLELSCSTCGVNKINSRISIINAKRHLSDKCLPKLICYYIGNINKPPISINIRINT